MRRTLPACRSAFPLAIAAVLLTACGGSDEPDPAASGSSASSSSAAETSAPAADSEFCQEAAAVQQRVTTTFTGESDLSTLPAVLQQAVEDIRVIEPPAELESDWTAFADGIQEVAAAAQIDFADPAAREGFQQEVGALQQQYGTSFANVQTYLGEECGLTADAVEPAAPTS